MPGEPGSASSPGGRWLAEARRLLRIAGGLQRAASESASPPKQAGRRQAALYPRTTSSDVANSHRMRDLGTGMQSRTHVRRTGGVGEGLRRGPAQPLSGALAPPPRAGAAPGRAGAGACYLVAAAAAHSCSDRSTQPLASSSGQGRPSRVLYGLKAWANRAPAGTMPHCRQGRAGGSASGRQECNGCARSPTAAAQRRRWGARRGPEASPPEGPAQEIGPGPGSPGAGCRRR